MKKLLFSLLGLLSLFPVAAQWKWHNPVEAAYPVVQNQGFVQEIGQSFVRLPDRAHGVVSENVWNLSRNSAGLALHFYSNASQIRVRYTVAGGYSMPHMPATVGRRFVPHRQRRSLAILFRKLCVPRYHFLYLSTDRPQPPA